MNTHLLKTHQVFFRATWEGLKTFEIRYNDRAFQIGDTLILQEVIYDGGHLYYTGSEIMATITYRLMLNEVPGLYNGMLDNRWIVMGINVTQRMGIDMAINEKEDVPNKMELSQT